MPTPAKIRSSRCSTPATSTSSPDSRDGEPTRMHSAERWAFWITRSRAQAWHVRCLRRRTGMSTPTSRPSSTTTRSTSHTNSRRVSTLPDPFGRPTTTRWSWTSAWCPSPPPACSAVGSCSACCAWPTSDAVGAARAGHRAGSGSRLYPRRTTGSTTSIRRSSAARRSVGEQPPIGGRTTHRSHPSSSR